MIPQPQLDRKDGPLNDNHHRRSHHQISYVQREREFQVVDENRSYPDSDLHSADISPTRSRASAGGLRMQTNHPSRCPPLNLQFLWKLYHQRQRVEAANLSVLPDEERVLVLQSQGFPAGLASMILHHSKQSPLRIWLINNTGTMHRNDGHILSRTSDGKVDIVDCSRWQEVCSMVEWHAEMAAWCQTPMAIRFLRDPGINVGPQQLGVSASKTHSAEEEIARLKSLLHKIRPFGASSPLHQQIREIFPAIQNLLPRLKDTSNTIVLNICTDSIPTNTNGYEDMEIIEKFLLTVQQLTIWPVQVVFRLVTDEERVVKFYHRLATHHGMTRVQILDDYIHECRMVQKYNPWLHYGYPLHLCREEGIFSDVFEQLSKRPLSGIEVLETIRTIFGQRHPQDQMTYSAFRKQVEGWNKDGDKLWNPIKKKEVAWVDLKKLDKWHKGSTSGGVDSCVIM